MPEGHTIHRLAAEMSELVDRQVRAGSPQGRFPAEQVDGGVVSGVQAHGKHLLITLRSFDRLRTGGAQGAGAEARTVHVHLGMRGKWLRFSPVTGPGLKQVRLRLSTDDLAWDLIAPSTCELLDADGVAALLDTLGPDPLRPDADPAEAARRLHAHPGTVGAALMDQSVLAGVGNVFRAEILHACRIAPTRAAARVTGAELDQLWTGLQAMMRQGVADGRIITVDVPEGEDRQAVPEAESRRVYRRTACYDCGTPVVTATLAGRTSYACPRCQPA